MEVDHLKIYQDDEVAEIKAQIRSIYENCHVGNPKHMNIMVLGLRGNGKSSFINTVSSSFYNKYYGWAPVGASDTQPLTLEYGVYRPVVAHAAADQSIHLYDTRGLSDDDHTDLILACVNGKFRPKTIMDDVRYRWKFWGDDTSNTDWFSKKERKIHGIIFVRKFGAPIPVNLANSIKRVSDKTGVPVGVALTFCDKVENPSYQMIEEETQKYQAFFNRSLVCLVDNYRSGSTQIIATTSGRVLSFISQIQQQAVSRMESDDGFCNVM